MIDIIKTKITNKSEKTFLYRLSFGTYTLLPGASITVDGDLFTKETRQEGVTESILVSAYNGDLDITVIVDDKFVASVVKEEVTKLPARSQIRLVNKPVVVEPVKTQVTQTIKPVVEEEPKVEAKPAEVKKEVTAEPAPVAKEEFKEEFKEESKQVKKEESSLETTEIEEPKKAKKATKI